MSAIPIQVDGLAKVSILNQVQIRRVNNPSIDIQKRAEIISLANDFVSELNLDTRDIFSFNERVVNFLYKRKTDGDLSNAMFFIRNLTSLAAIRYEDDSSIIGVERVFENAEDVLKKRGNLSGFYFEPIAALSLLENGYMIKELSARHFTNGQKTERFISSDRKEREIDIVAQKDLGDKIVTLFIDAKTCIAALRERDKKNHQVNALIELANKYDAVPIIVLRTKDPVITFDGKLMDYNPLSLSTRTNTDIANLLSGKKELLIWDEDGNDIVTVTKKQIL